MFVFCGFVVSYMLATSMLADECGDVLNAGTQSFSLISPQTLLDTLGLHTSTITLRFVDCCHRHGEAFRHSIAHVSNARG